MVLDYLGIRFVLEFAFNFATASVASYFGCCDFISGYKFQFHPRVSSNGCGWKGRSVVVIPTVHLFSYSSRIRSSMSLHRTHCFT